MAVSNVGLRLYFNGENQLYKKVSANTTQTYFDSLGNKVFRTKADENSFLGYATRYVGETGEPATSKFAEVLELVNIGGEENIFLKFKKDNSTTPSFLPPDRSNLFVTFRKNAESSERVIANASTYATLYANNVFRYEIKRALVSGFGLTEDEFNKLDESSKLTIKFKSVAKSNEEFSYTSAIMEFQFVDDINGNTNIEYKEYNIGTNLGLEYIRTMNSNNELPSFDVCTQDGNVSLIDSDKYILERIKTNTLNDNVLVDLMINGKKNGRFIASKPNYPLYQNQFDFELDDDTTKLEEIGINGYLYSATPNIEVDGFTLFNDLANTTIEKYPCMFNPLSDNVKQYLQDFTFRNPYIPCTNLKEMWQHFLIATLSTLYLDDNGNFTLEPYQINNDSDNAVIVITPDKTNQDVKVNLSPDNAISKVNYSTYESTFNGSFVREQLTVISDVSNSQITYTDLFDSFSKATEFPISGTQNGKTYTCYAYDSTNNKFLIETEIEFLGSPIQHYSVRTLFQFLNYNSSSNLNNYSSYDGFALELYPRSEYEALTINNMTTANGIYALEEKVGGKNVLTRKCKFVVTANNSNIYLKEWQVDFYISNKTTALSLGGASSNKKVFTLGQSSLITLNNTKGTQYLHDWLPNRILESYKNGKKSISFSTHNFDFLGEYAKNGETLSKIKYQAQNGQILKVGDYIRLTDVGNTNFKISKISVSYEGGITININAYEL